MDKVLKKQKNSVILTKIEQLLFSKVNTFTKSHKVLEK